MKKILGGFLLWSLLAICGLAHAGTVTYVYTDPQGTPLAEADANGNITATFEYTPYGTYAPQGTSAPGATPNGPGYTGHVNDPETNLVYMQARYYDPATGHFLSADPVGPDGGNTFSFNRYAYVDNNPVIHTDPNGKQCAQCLYYPTNGIDHQAEMQAAASGMALNQAKTLIPIVGNALAIRDAYNNPTTFNVVLAVIGVVPDVGVAVGAIKEAKALSQVAKASAVESTTLTRAAYAEEVEGLKDLANSARAAGQDAEATARMVSAERNALKTKYRELSPPDFVQKAETRNIQKYGNPLGPTVDQLRAQGKTWEEIIDSAARPGGKDMGL